MCAHARLRKESRPRIRISEFGLEALSRGISPRRSVSVPQPIFGPLECLRAVLFAEANVEAMCSRLQLDGAFRCALSNVCSKQQQNLIIPMQFSRRREKRDPEKMASKGIFSTYVCCSDVTTSALLPCLSKHGPRSRR